MERKKVGIVFSGGPAPAANSVISSLTLSFLNENIPVVGFIKGFEFMEKFNKRDPLSLLPDYHYRLLGAEVTKIRHGSGVLIKTSRANPGRNIKTREDLKDERKARPLLNIIDALKYLNIEVLFTIGGDDTLKTANYLRLLGFPVIHIPKTIDNDYYGIAWTFGYWTAVDVYRKLLLNLRADAEATDAYYIVEIMGRKSGWLTYAAGIAGEAVMMLSTEDFQDEDFNVDDVAERIVEVILQREREHKLYGVVCVSEGLAEKLPMEFRPRKKDKHGNVIYGAAEIGKLLAERVALKYRDRTGKSKKVVGKQIGYETRSAPPISFDIVLGSMLGYGGYILYKKKLFGHMVSLTDNFDIKGIPFDDLIDPETLLTKIRFVSKGSDFYNLKEALSYKPFE